MSADRKPSFHRPTIRLLFFALPSIARRPSGPSGKALDLFENFLTVNNDHLGGRRIK